jgi:hypothetical protein
MKGQPPTNVDGDKKLRVGCPALLDTTCKEIPIPRVDVNLGDPEYRKFVLLYYHAGRQSKSCVTGAREKRTLHFVPEHIT